MGERFEKFKLELHNKIKQGTIESNLNGERVLMKYGGWPWAREWHVIYPAVIEENGQLKMQWMNFLFGGKKNLWKLLGFLVVAGLVFWSVSNLFSQYAALAKQCQPLLHPIFNVTGLQ